MPSFLQHFPYDNIRDFQRETLELLEKHWDHYDVFTIVAPTSYGKTAISKTLLNALYGASYIVPNNMLVSQMTDTFSDTRTLHRMDSYYCAEWKRPCSATRARLKSFCKGCQCSSDLATAKYRKGPGVYNYHTYMAHKLYRSTLVVDEAHLLVPMLQQMGEVVLWQHDYKYPSSAYRPDQMLAWAEKLPPKKQKTVKVELLLEQLQSSFPSHSVTRGVREFNGKGTVRGQPEDRDCIVITPLSARDKAGVMWPKSEVSKIILLSATIGPKDVESLGLSERRVAYLHSPSPIAPDKRPFHFLDTVAVNRATISHSLPVLAGEITRLAERHIGERGLIHVTYQLSDMLRPHLTDPRYIFHDKWNKKEQYEKYINTPGSILVACGLYEGINLPDDLGRWQVITKVPWPSLGDPAVKAMAERDEEWYLWQTAKTIIQAAGRICRHENDYGITYCLDSTFMRLYSNGQHLLPQWFQDCLRDGDIS
jgi:ATP-dependent DNA helicase DinG